MGPGFETNLLVFLLALAVLGGIGWVLRDPFKRLYRYCAAWIERDKREEEAARREVQQRRAAETELKEALHEDEPPVRPTSTEPKADENQVQLGGHHES